jgi:sulfur carrier protein ThiS
MKISVKLNARFARYLPGDAVNNETVVEANETSTVETILTELGLPLEKCRLVLINDEHSPPAERATRQLKEGDRITVWPPLTGGVIGGPCRVRLYGLRN